MAKFAQLAQVLEKRIARGDYTLKGFPSERPLARELGVSRVTLRKALDELESRRVLARIPNGRLVVNSRRAPTTAARTACLAPAFASPFLNQIRLALERQGHITGVPVRTIDFAHHDDPVIGETFAGFDSVFVTGIGDDAPERVRRQIERAGCRVVSVEGDLTAWGVPSLVLFPAEASRVLFEHLVERGHRRIDCFNTLPMTPNVVRRIDYWQRWIDEHDIEGDLFNHPVRYYDSPIRWGYERAHDLARQGHLTSGAVFFTGETSGMGATRALQENGIRVGRDIATCSLGGDGLYRFMNPSMTVVEMPRMEPYLKKYLEWMRSGARKWPGALLTTPRKASLFVGESSTSTRRRDP